MFSVEERDAARAFVLRMASEDPRITAGAVVGSFARGAADRWSDLDLTFAVADDVQLSDVLRDWTRQLEATLHAAPVWDLRVAGRTYRVFVLPGALQVDLSFTPASEFRPAGPAFDLLFGEAGPADSPPLPSPEHLFGLGVVQAMHGRRSIERGRYWQAEQAIGQIRECALSLACLQHGLEPSHGREFDALPADTLESAASSLVASVDPESLTIALDGAVRLLLDQTAGVEDLATRIEGDLRALAS